MNKTTIVHNHICQLALLFSASSASYINHYSSDSSYIHSNDTIDLALRTDIGGRPSGQLHGPPGNNKV